VTTVTLGLQAASQDSPVSSFISGLTRTYLSDTLPAWSYRNNAYYLGHVKPLYDGDDDDVYYI